MLAQPMLETPVATPVAAAEVVTSEQKAFFESKATSLRRACTALLLISFLCARPWPTAAWLGVFASMAVLCASPSKLLCRTRIARFLSAIVAVCAGYTVVTQAMAIHANRPENLSDQFQVQCVHVPKDTFAWGAHLVSTHLAAHKCQGVQFVLRHFLPSNGNATLTANATHPALLVEQWSQEEACDKAARIVTRFAKTYYIGSVLAHFFLFLSAVAVVKRACRLRCAAYRCGLLTWKPCGGCRSKCTTAAIKPLPAEVKPAAKELA